MHVHVVDHPLAATALTRLRDEQTPRSGFRAALRELGSFVVYEACRALPTRPIEITTPMGPTTGTALDADELPLLVPVLRAGLGMLESALDLLPDAHTGFVGVKRDEDTLLPAAYLDSVPPELGGRPVIVLDPMLATAGSAIHTCRLLRESSAGSITVACVLSAPEGVEALRESGLAEAHFTSAIDDNLNEFGYIVPGLGDAGDRQFGAF